jgi:hypothetical protein
VPTRAGDKVAVYPDEATKGAITLTKEELRRLETDDWLNDTLVDYHLWQLSDMLHDSISLERCYFFNSCAVSTSNLALLHVRGPPHANHSRRTAGNFSRSCAHAASQR